VTVSVNEDGSENVIFRPRDTWRDEVYWVRARALNCLHSFERHKELTGQKLTLDEQNELIFRGGYDRKIDSMKDATGAVDEVDSLLCTAFQLGGEVVKMDEKELNAVLDKMKKVEVEKPEPKPEPSENHVVRAEKVMQLSKGVFVGTLDDLI